jgi:Fe-S cluster biogenesis protein NfuA
MKVEEKIQEAIDKIKPYLQQDGGDLEFVKFEDGTAYVSLKGACATCPMADMEIANGIALALTSEIEEVENVVRV